LAVRDYDPPSRTQPVVAYDHRGHGDSSAASHGHPCHAAVEWWLPPSRSPHAATSLAPPTIVGLGRHDRAAAHWCRRRQRIAAGPRIPTFRRRRGRSVRPWSPGVPARWGARRGWGEEA